ncbi:MAG TPA: DUF5686 family protein, partial [Flavisolibacter sp.]|nr:DUF5686 family protein [Flavisolibacter sp.]
YIGYLTKNVTITPGQEQAITVELKLDPKRDLSAVTVKSRKKINYKNKDNPAVELIRRVIAAKEKNRPTQYDYTEYEQYEKIQLSLSRKSEKLSKSKLLKNYQFLLENTDTTKVKGKALTPIYLEERLTQQYYRKDPSVKRTIPLGDKRVNYGDFIDSNGVTSYLKRLYEDVDVYSNRISVFTNDFLSPLADIAPTFYMYFIRDTITDANGRKLVQLYFTPRNTNDFLFRGTFYVTLDTNYAVQKLNMTVSPNINLNWVRDLRISQEFEQNPSDGRYHLIKSVTFSEAGLTKNKSQGGIFGERSVSYKNYKINASHETAFYESLSNNAAVPTGLPDSFWNARRHDTLSRAEASVYKNIDSLRQMKSFKRTVDLATLFLAGYKSFGKFEVGPASTFYSFNPVEGFRLRFGGRTTPALSKRLYFETYGAYGFKDEKWKGFFSFTYSLNNKSIYGFPLNYIRASAQRETKIPGQELQFVQEDNLLLSFKRGKNDKWLYNDIYRLDYVHEFSNRVSYTIGFKNWKQTPAGALQYQQMKGPVLVPVPDLRTSEVSVQLRWAPHEQFYQGKLYRIPIINFYPIFNLRYTRGIKDFLGGGFDYDKFNASVEKRVSLGQLGYSDVTVEGTYISGQLPYPLLNIHRANQTYAYQFNSYNLMNFLEFISDHSVGVNIDHHFNGLIFNRIPLINKLNLREIIAGKFLWGGLRNENDPDAGHPSLYQYPKDDQGQNYTYALGSKPYIEASIGIGNIFRLLRVDVIKRFTYLDHPDVATWGIRGRMKFDF